MGKLRLLELAPLSISTVFTVPPDEPAGIDTAAAATIAGMGGGEFL
jgi:hypothetical protein